MFTVGNKCLNIHKNINLYHYSENNYTYYTYTLIINIYKDEFSIYMLCHNPLSSFIACPSIIFFTLLNEIAVYIILYS